MNNTGMAGRASNEASESIKQAEPNHIALSNAISDMESVIGHADSLLNKIIGHPTAPPLENGEDRIEPSLSETLQGAPDLINGRNEEMHSLLNRIEELLF